MPSAAQEQTLVERTRAQHRAIEIWLASIQKLLQGLIEAEPPGDRADEALGQIQRLARELPDHFAGEEAADGLFAKALAVAPRLERRVLALRQEHEPLGTELERILQEARYAGVATDAWRSVAERFAAFAEAVRAHEIAEGRIVAEAYLRDLGSG